MIKIEINGTEFLLKSNLSVLEACKYVGIHIPRFCYHETLSVAGNCRMCLVEVANSPKPVASCALPILNNMKIFVDTPLVKKARENVLETLLLNHPLDCPICDQGGECDLQDQTKLFGSDYSRFFFSKRGVEDKYCGPLIKTIMTRCIHCTRCVRFGIEVAGVEYLGTINRGTHTEIGGYISQSFNSEISGNVIDLCPVGALTSKPYAFKARPWELRTTESIDLTDGTGSNVFVNFKETEILRIIPKINKNINGSIITDKARFSNDSTKNERIYHIFEKKNNKYEKVLSWSTILEKFDIIFSTKKTLFIINDEIDTLVLNALKKLSYKNPFISVKSISKKANFNIFFNWFQNNLNDLNYLSKICLLISSNIRIESAIINSKLRLKYLNEDFSIFSSGLKYNSNFPINFINLSSKNLINILEGKNSLISSFLLKFKSPLILIGQSIFKRGFSFSNISMFIKEFLPSAIVFNISLFSNSEGLNLLNIKSISKKDFENHDVIMGVNLDESALILNNLNLKNKKLIWLNTHGSLTASKSDLILPLFSEYEEEKLLLNLEQRPQKSFKIINGIGNARSFIKLLNYYMTKEISSPYLNFLIETVSNPLKFNKIKKFSLNFFNSFGRNKEFISLFPIKASFEDFYRSNKFTKKSLIMSKCSQELRKNSNNF